MTNQKLVRTSHTGSSGEKSIHRGLQSSAIELDLNGDGVQTVSQQSSGVVFDVDAAVDAANDPQFPLLSKAV